MFVFPLIVVDLHLGLSVSLSPVPYPFRIYVSHILPRCPTVRFQTSNATLSEPLTLIATL